MKKIWILTLILTLCLCACGTGGFAEADLFLTVDGVNVTAKTEMDQILADLGENYEYSEAISCVYEGMDKTFDYENLSLDTYPDGDSDRLREIYCVGGNVTTSKGITFGATKAEIIAQYGKDYVEAGATLSYELPVKNADNLPASLYFVLEDDAVTAIAMTTEHRAE